MARQTLILANSITEANDYARLAGLERFTYRAVRSAGAIKGVRNAEVHILPSFVSRLDRHAILSALAYARTLEVFYVDPADLDEPEDSNALESGTPPTDEEIEAAYAEHDERERSEATNGSVEPSLVEVVTDGEHKTQESLRQAAEEEIVAALEPEGFTPPETLSAADVLALAAEPNKPAADVLEPKAPKQRQRKPRQPKPAAAPADFF